MTASVAGVDARERPVVGRTLGGFIVRKRLGHGGQGLIFAAEQPVLGREAVIKVLDPRRRASDGAIARFLREARLASMLDHPYAAHVYAAGAEPDGLVWIAMELVNGTPLDRLIRTSGPLPLERFVPLFDRLCQVVHTAHEHGLIHRDIKPANVMVIARAGRLLPKLLDFGVAAIAGEPHAGGPSRGLIGSPAYMPPEQWLDPDAADAATDLYQLGVLGWEALAGRRPYEAATLPALAHAHATEPVPVLPAPAPAALAAVFARALAKRPADRFATALELAAAVREAATTGHRSALPQLDEPLRDVLIRAAPQPIADAVAALEAATDVRAAWDAIGAVITAATRWLGAVALCAGARVAAPATATSRSAALLDRLRDDGLDDAGWMQLVREQCRPFAALRDAFPVPELVAAVVTEHGADRDPFAAVLATRAAVRTGSGDAVERLGDVIGIAIAELAAALRAIAFVTDYRIGVASGDAFELWSGVSHAPRARIAAAGPALPDGAAAVITVDGAAVLELAPIVQVAAPSPGLARELFVLDGSGRRGARMVAYPARYERHDVRPWPWLAARGLVAGPVAAEHDATEPRPPWRGLATLGADDTAMFVGREREVEAAVNRLRTQPWLAIVGASGTGKSSLVQAGILPALGPRWTAITVRPGPAPWAALATRLARDAIALGDGGDPDELCRRLRAVGPVVLVVDQLEELFTLCRDPDERRRYAAALARTAIDAADHVRLVVTLRDDFLIRLAELDAFRDRLATGLQLVTTPARPDLLRILTEPAARTGYGFDDPALPAEMVDAVADAPGALALLSFTATRLWELRDRGLRQLSRRAYDALGGVAGALARHAEQTVGELTAAEHALAREAFRHLVTGAGTRAVLTRAEILQLLGGGADGERVVERLVAARLLHASDASEDADRIEVIHEALLSAWPRLVQWRREDADGARMREELRDAARRWHDRGRPRGMLWRDETLAEYRLWRARSPGALTDVEAAFAAASLADADRARRRRRVAVAAGFAIVAGFAVLQLIARTEAQDQRTRAEDRLVANYQEHARRLYLDDDPVRALAYAAEARALGADGPTLDYLVGRLLRGLGRETASLDAGGRVMSLAVSADATRVIAASAAGHAVVWDGDGRPIATCGHHEQAVFRAAMSPDGSAIVTASWDGTARVWDARTCALRATLTGHAGRVFWTGFSPDGTWVFTTGTDGTARIWDAASGAPVHVLDLGAPAYAAAFSPDGTRFVAASPEPPGGARLWAMPDGRPIATLDIGSIETLAFDRAGGRVLAAGAGKAVVVFDAATGATLRTLVHPQGISAAAWSPDGDAIATGDESGVIRIWDVAAGTASYQLGAHTGRITALEFSPGGTRLASGGMDGRVIVWDVASGTPAIRIHGHTDAIAGVAFLAGEARLATASWDHTVRLWDLDAPDATTLGRDAAFARFDPSGATVVVAAGSEIAVHDAATGAARCIHRGHAAAVTAGAIAPGGAIAATGDQAGAIRIWDARTCAAIREVAALDRGPIAALDFAPDGSRLVTAGDDGVVRVWDVATGDAIGAAEIGVPIAATGFSPDGTVIYAVPRGGYVTTPAANAGVVLDARTLARTAVLPHGRPLERLAFAADGRIMTMSRDGTAVMWRDGVAVTRLAATAGAWFDAALDPAGDRIVTCGQDPEAQVWDARTGAKLGALSRHGGYVLSCGFSADGRYIVTASTDGTARIWDATTRQPLDSLTLAATPDPLAWPVARFSPDGLELLTWARAGEVRLWRLGAGPIDAAALDRARCKVPWRVANGVLVPAGEDGPRC